MPRPIWKGHISFGLIHIPVNLYSAENRTDIRLHMLDSRNQRRVRYERVNEETGEEVPWSEVVKAYEYDDGNFVVLSDDELQNIKPEATKTLDIDSFVPQSEMDCFYYEKPYYLEPVKQSEKSYVLLRETLKRTKTVGLAKVVIRTRQYLAAIMPRGHALVVNLLRFYQEIKSVDDFKIPEGSVKDLKISAKEIEMATNLVDAMTESWKPEKFVDDYRVALQKYVDEKRTDKKAPRRKQATVAEKGKVVDITALLKKSLEREKVGTKKSREKKAS